MAETPVNTGTNGSAPAIQPTQPVNVPHAAHTPKFNKVTADDLFEMYEEDAKPASANGAAKPSGGNANGTTAKPGKGGGDKPHIQTESAEAPTPNKGSEVKEGETEEAPEEGGEAKPKAVIGKRGDEDLEIPEDTTFSVKLENGKTVDAPLAQVLKAYAGMESFNRQADARVQKIVQREKTYEGKVSGLTNQFKQIVDLSRQGDWLPVLTQLAEWSGQDPIEYEKGALATMQQIAQRMAGMSEQDKQRYFLDRKAEMLAKKEQAFTTEAQKRQAEAQLDQQIVQTSQALGLSQEQFWQMFEQVLEIKNPDGSPYFKSENDVEIKDIVNFHKMKEATSRALDAMEKLGQDPDENLNLYNKILPIAFQYPELDTDDIIDIVRDATNNSQSVENLNRKVSEANKRGFRTFVNGQVSSQAKQNAEPESWDDL